MLAETYDGTAAARIAKRAKVPEGLGFHYLPQNVDILAALIEERAAIQVLSGHFPQTRQPRGLDSRGTSRCGPPQRCGGSR
ncbi:MAG TPA: hypothetical protein VLW50_09785 [Streptosporangiaceae bacterium]|nr:hypothetical protein [Streptosporangiaceae bacterium]